MECNLFSLWYSWNITHKSITHYCNLFSLWYSWNITHKSIAHYCNLFSLWYSWNITHKSIAHYCNLWVIHGNYLAEYKIVIFSLCTLLILVTERYYSLSFCVCIITPFLLGQKSKYQHGKYIADYSCVWITVKYLL